MRSTIDTDRNIPCMIDVREVAEILSISTRSVWRLVADGELPQPIRFGRNVRWRLTDIEVWIEARASMNQNGSPRRPR
jgi:excisionase family DNA binding protein